MNIVLLDAKTLGDLEILKELAALGNFISYPTTTPEHTKSRIVNADIVITNKVVIGKEEIEATPSLKLICVAATGTNNIDLNAAEEKGVEVRNVKGYSTNSVAQQTFAMLFQALNHISYYDQFVKSGQYSRYDIFTCLERPVFELKGKTFGIIGLGAIGKRVAEIASCFGANVIYYSTSGKNTESKYRNVSLEELLTISDVISIHAPLNDQTKNLIGYAQLSKMKKTSILLNTGRGGIIQEEELAKALDENKIAMACIDVFAKEPIDEKNPLLSVKNKEKLILMPHTAWASVEARTELVRGIIHNINTFLNK